MDPLVEVEFVDRAAADARPRRFAVSRYPVTVAEYRQFIQAGGYTEDRWWSTPGMTWRTAHGIRAPADWDRPGFDDPRMPVTGVSFWEAQAYARFRDADLPTEEEWYLVASNGGRTRYPWGDDDPVGAIDRANLTFFGSLAPSGRLPVDRSNAGASAHGVVDLIGNAGEWCYPGGSPELASDAQFAVLRGGSSWHVPGVADATFRDVVVLTIRDSQGGIRLVRRPMAERPSIRSAIVRPETGARRPLGRALKRPFAPFRQEGCPAEISADAWRLAVRGEHVGRPRTFSLAELQQQFTAETVEGLFVCVCRWGQHNTFTGASLEALLDACEVSWRARSAYLLQRSTSGRDGRRYETTVPIAEAVKNRALLAWAMDGAPLTMDYGWPLRFVDLSRLGYKGVKCVNELVVTDRYERGWWEREAQYELEGRIMPGTITVVGSDAFRFELTAGETPR